MQECFGIKQGKCGILKDVRVCNPATCKFYKTAEQVRADEEKAAQGLYRRTGMKPHEYMGNRVKF